MFNKMYMQINGKKFPLKLFLLPSIFFLNFSYISSIFLNPNVA